MMQGDMARAGHSYFGIVNNAQEAHAILEASKLGLLPRVTRRLTDEERTRFVRAGAVFVWEEEEAGIRRWTDHIKWSPSRVSGAFLTYTEVPTSGEPASRSDDTLIKQSFSATDANGSKMHLIAYTSKSAFTSGVLPLASRDPLVQHMLAQRTRTGHDPRDRPDPPFELFARASALRTQSSSSPPTPSSALLFSDLGRSQSNPSSSHSSSILSLATPSFARSVSASSDSSMQEVLATAAPTLVTAQVDQHEHLLRRGKGPAPPSIQTSSAVLGMRGYRYDPVRDGPASAPPEMSEFPPSPSWHRSNLSETSVQSAPAASPLSESPPSTRASPYDSHPRLLPPLDPPPTASGLVVPRSISPARSPEGGLASLFPEGGSNHATRGSEDQRQLRLLERGFSF